MTIALFGVGDGRPFHRPLHRSRATAGTDIKAPQPQLVPHILGINVLLAADGVPPPADHQVGLDPRGNGIGMPQDMKDLVGDRLGGAQVLVIKAKFVAHIEQVAQHRKQILPNAGNDLAIDKGAGRRIHQIELQTTMLLTDVDFEVAIGFHHHP